MAIALPIIAAKKTIQEQAQQQRQTQRERFGQDMIQQVGKSVLDLGTTLGVEIYKESRPSVQARKLYTDQLTAGAKQALKEAEGRWTEFSTPEAVARRERASEQALTVTEQGITASTAKLNQTRLLAAEANLHIDDEGNFYFLEEAPAPAEGAPLDLGRPKGPTAVDLPHIEPTPLRTVPEGAGGYRSEVAPTGLYDRHTPVGKISPLEQATQPEPGPRKIFVNTPEGIARGQKEIAALRESIVKMGFVKPGEAKNMSVNTILGTMQMSFSKQYRPRGPVRLPKDIDRLKDYKDLREILKPWQKHWATRQQSHKDIQSFLVGDPANAKLQQTMPVALRLINQIQRQGPYFVGQSPEQVVFDLIQRGAYEPGAEAGRSVTAHENLWDQSFGEAPGTTLGQFAFEFDDPAHRDAISRATGYVLSQHDLNPQTGERTKLMDGSTTGVFNVLKGKEVEDAVIEHLQGVHGGLWQYQLAPGEQMPGVHPAYMDTAKTIRLNILNLAQHLIEVKTTKSPLDSQLLAAIASNRGIMTSPPPGPSPYGPPYSPPPAPVPPAGAPRSL